MILTLVDDTQRFKTTEEEVTADLAKIIKKKQPRIRIEPDSVIGFLQSCDKSLGMISCFLLKSKEKFWDGSYSSWWCYEHCWNEIKDLLIRQWQSLRNLDLGFKKLFCGQTAIKHYQCHR